MSNYYGPSMNELLSQWGFYNGNFTVTGNLTVLCHQEVEGLVAPAVRGRMRCVMEKGHQGPCTPPQRRGPLLRWHTTAPLGKVSLTCDPNIPPGKFVIK